jgi:16S rRNA (uracil1498-N3)-methyltransferase
MLPDRTVPFAYVDDLEQPVLGDADAHHLGRVRRLRPGDPLVLGDGRGGVRAARFGDPPQPDGPVTRVPKPAPAITVAFALTKGDRPEVAVQKLTEVGVDVIVPFVSARTVVRWDDQKAVRHVERWRVIAREAAAQAHRPWLPTVAELARFDEVAALPGAALAHPDGSAPTLGHPTLLVGPEGGWDPAEEAAPLARVRLGPHVLRAETAAIVAGALLAALRDVPVNPSS